MKSLARSALIARAAEIEGWFDEVELGLLVDCVTEVARRNSNPLGNLNIVEVGSYKGRCGAEGTIEYTEGTRPTTTFSIIQNVLA